MGTVERIDTLWKMANKYFEKIHFLAMGIFLLSVIRSKTAFGKPSSPEYEEYAEYPEFPENIDDIVCRTIGGPRPDNPCVFPFIFQGENRTECIEGRLRPKPWCATKVDESNNYIPQEWGICGESCSKSGNLEAPTNSTLVSPKK